MRGAVSIRGTVSVTGNTVINSTPETASNVVLDKNGIIKCKWCSYRFYNWISCSRSCGRKNCGKTCRRRYRCNTVRCYLSDTYEGDSAYKLADDGTLVSAAEPTPTPGVDMVVKGIDMKWTGHNSVEVTFQSNVKGTY